MATRGINAVAASAGVQNNSKAAATKVPAGKATLKSSPTTAAAAKESPAAPIRAGVPLNDLLQSMINGQQRVDALDAAEAEAALLQQKIEEILTRRQMAEANCSTHSNEAADTDAAGAQLAANSAAAASSAAAQSRSLALQTRRAHITALRAKLAADTAAVSRRRSLILSRRQSLQPSLTLLHNAQSNLLTLKAALERNARKNITDLGLQLHLIQLRQSFRRRTLLHHLSTIYPLAPPRGALHQPLPYASPHPLTCYTIRGLRLPNNVQNILTSFEEEQVSTALGYVAHLCLLMAKYLEIPLRYRIIARGSRSVIADDVTAASQFPLYFKNMEERRFELGVILLNKNIEQMLQVRLADAPATYTKKVRDLTCTLENLDLLFKNELPQ